MQGRDVIFMETAVRLGDSRSHAQLEAIPVTAKQLSRAPIMFKKVHSCRTCRLLLRDTASREFCGVENVFQTGNKWSLRAPHVNTKFLRNYRFKTKFFLWRSVRTTWVRDCQQRFPLAKREFSCWWDWNTRSWTRVLTILICRDFTSHDGKGITQRLRLCLPSGH